MHNADQGNFSLRFSNDPAGTKTEACRKHFERNMGFEVSLEVESCPQDDYYVAFHSYRGLSPGNEWPGRLLTVCIVEILVAVHCFD